MRFEGQDQVSNDLEKLDKVLQKSIVGNKKKQMLCATHMKEETNTKIYKNV